MQVKVTNDIKDKYGEFTLCEQKGDVDYSIVNMVEQDKKSGKLIGFIKK